MTPITFDTSVIIGYKLQRAPESYIWSAVVLAELSACAKDDSERKAIQYYSHVRLKRGGAFSGRNASH